MTVEEVMIQQESIAVLLVARADGVERLVLRFFGQHSPARLQERVADLLVSIALSDEQVRDQGRLPFARMSREAD